MRNIDVEREQNSLFPTGSVIKCFVIPPTQNTQKALCKRKKKLCKNHLLDADTNLPRFQGERLDYVRVKSSKRKEWFYNVYLFVCLFVFLVSLIFFFTC